MIENKPLKDELRAEKPEGELSKGKRKHLREGKGREQLLLIHTERCVDAVWFPYGLLLTLTALHVHRVKARNV